MTVAVFKLKEGKYVIVQTVEKFKRVNSTKFQSWSRESL